MEILQAITRRVDSGSPFFICQLLQFEVRVVIDLLDSLWWKGVNEVGVNFRLFHWFFEHFHMHQLLRKFAPLFGKWVFPGENSAGTISLTGCWMVGCSTTSTGHLRAQV